nr:reverse transcriptase domain-containing protein [Tanacetum cinerariifolium]
MRECLNKQIETLVEETTHIYKINNEEEEDGNKDKVVYADLREALVTQRVLYVAVSKPDDASWLQNNIFRTKCTSKWKVCSVIINGRSCKNMVVTSTVEKLGLDVEDHTTPYQLT